VGRGWGSITRPYSDGGSGGGGWNWRLTSSPHSVAAGASSASCCSSLVPAARLSQGADELCLARTPAALRTASLSHSTHRVGTDDGRRKARCCDWAGPPRTAGSETGLSSWGRTDGLATSDHCGRETRSECAARTPSCRRIADGQTRARVCFVDQIGLADSVQPSVTVRAVRKCT